MVLSHLSEELWTGKDFFENKVVRAYRLINVSAQTATTSNKIYEKIVKKSANSLQNLILCTREETKVKKHERGWKKRGKSQECWWLELHKIVTERNNKQEQEE